MTGWRFLRTWRWAGYITSALLFAVVCVLLSNWQFDRGRQATTENTIVAANFYATPIPIQEALPTLDSFDPDQNWQRVTITGVFRAEDELVVRNRPHGGNNGFEVLTPLQLSDGSIFMVNRGWVAPSPGDVLAPDFIPQPPTGTVKVVVQLRPSETLRGSGTPAGDQIGSITLSTVQQKIAGDLYSGAYGVLDSESTAAQTELTPIQPTMPVQDVGTHYSYAGQWLLFALIGFAVLGLGMRKEYRRLNIDDPEERVRASKRMRNRASKPFTDEELEDESIDGYIPLTRWGISTSPATRPASSPRAIPPRTEGRVTDGRVIKTEELPEPTIYVIHTALDPVDDEPDGPSIK
jgi:cytochrome oxidase assembly protein ShyY1